MIAPLRSAEPPSEIQHRLARARRAVARRLLPTTTNPSPQPVPSWRAWLLVAWMVVVAVGYVTRILGLWG